MYIYVYIYVHVCIYIYIHICLCMYNFTDTPVYIFHAIPITRSYLHTVIQIRMVRSFSYLSLFWLVYILHMEDTFWFELCNSIFNLIKLQ
jgi:hypothetical protein